MAPDPATQAARIKELEAALARQAPPPATGFATIYQLLNTVLGMFPRWLIVAAGVVAVTFVAWGAYNAAMILDMDRQNRKLELKANQIDDFTFSGRASPTSGPAECYSKKLIGSDSAKTRCPIGTPANPAK